MGKFEEWGRNLDSLTEKLKKVTQEETKEWRKKLDELGEKIKKLTREGLEKITTEARGLGEMAKLRFRIQEEKKKLELALRNLGEETHKLWVKRKINLPSLRELATQVTKLKKGIEAKEKELKSLRKG